MKKILIILSLVLLLILTLTAFAGCDINLKETRLIGNLKFEVSHSNNETTTFNWAFNLDLFPQYKVKSATLEFKLCDKKNNEMDRITVTDFAQKGKVLYGTINLNGSYDKLVIIDCQNVEYYDFWTSYKLHIFIISGIVVFLSIIYLILVYIFKWKVSNLFSWIPNIFHPIALSIIVFFVSGIIYLIINFVFTILLILAGIVAFFILALIDHFLIFVIPNKYFDIFIPSRKRRRKQIVNATAVPYSYYTPPNNEVETENNDEIVSDESTEEENFVDESFDDDTPFKD